MKKTEQVLQFKVIIEQDEDGVYVASVPELQGCYTQGKTLEQVRERIREAIELVLETDQKVVDEKKEYPYAIPRFFGTEDVYIHQYA